MRRSAAVEAALPGFNARTIRWNFASSLTGRSTKRCNLVRDPPIGRSSTLCDTLGTSRKCDTCASIESWPKTIH